MLDVKREEKIVEGIIHKDEKVLFGFVGQHKAALFQFINRQLHDQHLAEEIMQDTFMDFIDALRDFHYQSSLKTYLFSIARNKVIDTIRKKKIKKIVFSHLPSYVVEGLAPIFMDQEIEQKELAAKIGAVIEDLPHDYQVILRLKYIEGEKVQIIAQKLQLTFKATESLLFRARKAFVKSFNRS